MESSSIHEKLKMASWCLKVVALISIRVLAKKRLYGMGQRNSAAILNEFPGNGVGMLTVRSAMLVCPCWGVFSEEEEKQRCAKCGQLFSLFLLLLLFVVEGRVDQRGRVGFLLRPFHVGVSHRRFSVNLLPPLATFPTTSLHHTTLVLICIRFTCPRCYSEGQEDGLVVPHADVGSNVIINY